MGVPHYQCTSGKQFGSPAFLKLPHFPQCTRNALSLYVCRWFGSTNVAKYYYENKLIPRFSRRGNDDAPSDDALVVLIWLFFGDVEVFQVGVRHADVFF